MRTCQTMIIQITNLNFTIVNYYCPDNVNLNIQNINVKSENFIIVGDFNSHSQSWRYNHIDNRGEEIEYWQDENNLTLINQPNDAPTFYSRVCHTTSTQVIASEIKRNNRVLKKRPPLILDEEQRLNQKQRCTLSQLRSGHCHRLQDYKHRVFGEPSDICTDCEASPQDVRHLFACTTHPTDLSPEDLWGNPVRSIRAFSYLYNGNLD